MSERIISTRIITNLGQIIVVQCYALRDIYELYAKEEFYDELFHKMQKICNENEGLKNIMGKHSPGTSKDNRGYRSKYNLVLGPS